ncbi:MAG: alternative ribosome rescue factor ArfA [Alphaproteobacteria bacterium]|nr:alternative ribosome rescue factor ArfA [Alphaproteobacteria bacterium]
MARALRTPTFRQRKVRPKKGRGSYSRARETGRYVAL